MKSPIGSCSKSELVFSKFSTEKNPDHHVTVTASYLIPIEFA